MPEGRQRMNIEENSVISFVGAMAISWCCIVTDAAAQTTGIAGINLPPQQGTSNSGAFTNTPLSNVYTKKEVQDTLHHKKGIRILINPQTVNDPKQWRNTKKMADWALQRGGYVVFCMVDSNLIGGKPDTTVNDGHGDGLVDDISAAKSMWTKVATAYKAKPNVFFELFNEPFGYRDAPNYLSVMNQITPDNIPLDRIIIDGMGYADNVQAIKDGWGGLLGYHVYLTWLPEGKRTKSDYSNFVQNALAGVAPRTFVTEFGANLQLQKDYDDSSVPDADVQFLKGMDDAFNVLKPKGTFFYHGWNNGDAYSYWSGTESAKNKVDLTQTY
jgi:hypothetical protein